MVGNLHDIDAKVGLGSDDRGLRLRLHISGQEEGRAFGLEDDAHARIVRDRPGADHPARPHHPPTRRARCPDLPHPHGHRRRSDAVQPTEHHRDLFGGVVDGTDEHSGHLPVAQDSRQSVDVVSVEVGEDERGHRRDTEVVEASINEGRIGPTVDDDRGLLGVAYDESVTLTH